MKRTLLALAIAVLTGLPIGWLTAILLTPALWRLEPILGIELAGHSGPSDWVFVVIWVLLATAIFAAARRLLSHQ